eukprot:gene24984-33484_t
MSSKKVINQSTNSTAFSDITSFEDLMSLDNPIKSTTVTRWERKARQQQLQADRYIPSRSGMNAMATTFNDENFDKANTKEMNADQASGANKSRVLAFKNKAPLPAEGYQNSLKILYSAQTVKKEVVKTMRHIPSAPVRILDAPDILDDYYLNLLSWGSSNVLAVALSQCVYLWNAASGDIKELMTLDNDSNDYVSSVSWIQQGGSHLAVGTATNSVQLWDVQAGRQIRSLDGHSSRVGALAWNSHLLTSGGRDNLVINHDVRIQNHIVGKMAHHTQEVCGLAWSPDGTYLASGANDNTLCITDLASMHVQDATPKFVLTDHQAAVKALAWSPHERNLLASGGGTADRSIKFWNAASGALINSVDTGSQVCALQWSPYEKELLSSHGFAENQLCLWKYPSMARVKEFKGHTSRVLHLATSPDGSTVCSGAADETLRFWNIFAPEGKKKADSTFQSTASLSGTTSLHIR